MELILLGIVVIALGQLLRLISTDYLLGFNWIAKNKSTIKYLISIFQILGWLAIIFGRLILYLSFVPVTGNIILTGLIGLNELGCSIYISIGVKKMHKVFSIILDLSVSLIVVFYVVKLLSIEGLLFVI